MRRDRTRSKRAGQVAAPYRRQLRFEPLEDRRLLATFTVMNLDDLPVAAMDDAPGTLRQAIFDANNTPGADTIEFDSALTSGGPAAIVLDEGELAITDSLTITGPGADLLTIDASGNDLDPDTFGNGSRIFNIDDTTFNVGFVVEIRGLTLTGGDVAGQGGAILSQGSLLAEALVVTGNQATFGGAIAIISILLSGGESIVADCAIIENVASSQGGAFYVQGDPDSVVTIRNSTISHNTANRGGALYAGSSSQGSTLVITGNSIADNVALQHGGAIYLATSSAPNTTIQSSNITGNSAGSNGGAFYIRDSLDVTIVNCAISNNQSQSTGGAIYNNRGFVSITGSSISGNVAMTGAGIHSVSGQIAVNFTAIEQNTASLRGGGIASSSGRLSVIGSTISGNVVSSSASMTGGGGGLWLSGNEQFATITNSIVSNNAANNNGGAIYIASYGATLTLTDVVISGNTAIRGGGIANTITNYGATASLITISGGSISGNTAQQSGGGIYNRSANINAYGTSISGNQAGTNGGGIAIPSTGVRSMALSFAETTISSNSAGADGDGGGLYVSDDEALLSLFHCQIFGNSARNGGGIYRSRLQIAAPITIVDSSISGNTAALRGGGVYNRGGSVSLIRSTISNCTANSPDMGAGGGIFSQLAELSLTDSSLLNNVAPYGRGGGLYMSGRNLTISGTTIAGNAARVSGGGVYAINASGDHMTILSTTVSGNSSQLGAGGLFLGGSSTIRFSTITGNVGGGGSSVAGGLTFASSQPFELDHSIVAGNVQIDSVNPDIFVGNTQAITVQYNLIGSYSGTKLTEAPLGSPDVHGNLIGKPIAAGGSGIINPLLAGLSNNGGPTSTHALLPGSPALDGGVLVTGPPLGYDQRGNPFSRMVDGTGDGVVRIDVGAYESQGVPSFAPGDYNRNGRVDAADYTTWRDTLGRTGLEPYSGADGDGDGDVTPADYSVWKDHFGQSLVITPPGAGGGSIVAEALAEPMESAQQLAARPNVRIARPVPDLPARSDVVRRTPTEPRAGAMNDRAAARRDEALLAWLSSRAANRRHVDETHIRINRPDVDQAGDPIANAIDAALDAFGDVRHDA